jgi:hypothetical protein
MEEMIDDRAYDVITEHAAHQIPASQEHRPLPVIEQIADAPENGDFASGDG